VNVPRARRLMMQLASIRDSHCGPVAFRDDNNWEVKK